jgi:DUF971 family protein
MQQPYPTALRVVDDTRLVIEWSDGRTTSYSLRHLRDRCPCATCREKHREPPPASLLPVLSPAETQPLRIVAMRPVGNYAYSIAWSDGHDTGIYSFERLRELDETNP